MSVEIVAIAVLIGMVIGLVVGISLSRPTINS